MPIKVFCHWCNKPFTKPPKDFKRSKNFHFCSRECCNTWQREANKKVCKFCQKTFYKGRKNQLYCSVGCVHKAGKGGKIVLKCQVCNRDFTTWKNGKNRRKTCSKKCARMLKSQPRKKQVEVICEACEKVILLTENRAKGKRFCSKECQKRIEYRKPPIFINCKNCDKKIRIFPSRKNTTAFCNRGCQREYETSKRVRKVCPECNKEFEVIPSRQHFIYCSQECYLAVLSRGGDEHSRWKGGCAYYYGPNWQSQSEKARKRDNYICQVCGKHQNENYRDLDVHHKKRFQEFGLENYKQANCLSNLITLCPTCHHKAEAGKI